MTDAPAGAPPQDRRRHARTQPPASSRDAVRPASVFVDLLVEGIARAAGIADDVVQDASHGGLFVHCENPPRLGQRLVVRVRADDGRAAEVAARVVRVRWGGRRDGRAVSPGVALSFDDEPAARARVQDLIEISTRRPG